MARRISKGLSTSSLAAGLFFAFGAAPAHAQKAPELSTGLDEVILKNGGMLRGTVVAVEPDKSVTMFVMMTGEQRVIPWAEVARVDRGKNAALCPAPPAPRTQEAAPSSGLASSAEPPLASQADLELAYARGEPGVVRLHIDSPEPGMQLYRVNTSPYPQYRTNPGTVAAFPLSDLICLEPCDKYLDGRLGQQFFFGGSNMPPSAPFQVYKRSGTLNASVEPGSDARFISGIMTGTLGGITTILGATVWILGVAEGDVQKKNPDGTPMVNAAGAPITERGPLLAGGDIAGPIAFGVGAAALVVGILVGRSGEISYTLSPKSPARSMHLSPAGLAMRF